LGWEILDSREGDKRRAKFHLKREKMSSGFAMT